MNIIDDALLDRVSAEAKASPRRRMNHDFHERLDDPVNRLLNAMEPGTFFPVHRHLEPPKSESSLVLRGSVALFIFDDAGKIVQKTIVDPKEGRYGFDIEPGVWHGLLVLEKGTVLYEVKPGPYVPLSPADIAPWSPDERNPDAVSRFLAALQAELA